MVERRLDVLPEGLRELLGHGGGDVFAALIHLAYGADELCWRALLRRTPRRSRFQGPHGILVLRVHRQHQHLKLREFLAHELERLYTVAVRQGHVQQQHVARLLAQQAQRGRARIRLAHDLHVAAFDDDLVQTPPQDRVVVDDDHLDHDASVAPSGSGTGGCAGSSGSRATTVVPLPAAPPKLTSPPRLRARSSIPRSPNDPRLRRSVFSMPRPLSLTLSVTVPASTLSSTPTAVAPACLEMLVSVSRNTLKRALPSSGSM